MAQGASSDAESMFFLGLNERCLLGLCWGGSSEDWYVIMRAIIDGGYVDEE